MSGKPQPLAALPPAKEPPDTQWMEALVTPTAGLDILELLLLGIRIPDLPNRSILTKLTTLTWLSQNFIYQNKIVY
jgi:hypothetical protein